MGRISKVVKKPLPYDIDSGNEVNSESEEDMPATFVLEPIVAYLNNPDSNDSTKNDGDWVLNESLSIILCILMMCLIPLTQAPYTCPCLRQ